MKKNRRGFVLKNCKPIWLIFKCRFRQLPFVNPAGSEPVEGHSIKDYYN
jgi:hypothetical protein